jgi:hypothetical protein
MHRASRAPDQERHRGGCCRLPDRRARMRITPALPLSRKPRARRKIPSSTFGLSLRRRGTGEPARTPACASHPAPPTMRAHSVQVSIPRHVRQRDLECNVPRPDTLSRPLPQSDHLTPVVRRQNLPYRPGKPWATKPRLLVDHSLHVGGENGQSLAHFEPPKGLALPRRARLLAPGAHAGRPTVVAAGGQEHAGGGAAGLEDGDEEPHNLPFEYAPVRREDERRRAPRDTSGGGACVAG